MWYLREVIFNCCFLGTEKFHNVSQDLNKDISTCIIFLLKLLYGHLKSHWIWRRNISYEICVILMEEKAPMGRCIEKEGRGEKTSTNKGASDKNTIHGLAECFIHQHGIPHSSASFWSWNSLYSKKKKKKDSITEPTRWQYHVGLEKCPPRWCICSKY